MASDERWGGAVGDVEGQDVLRLGSLTACHGVVTVMSAILNWSGQKVAGVASSAVGPRRQRQRGVALAGGQGRVLRIMGVALAQAPIPVSS
jgi:hypothetical protein